jgi:hypothetical protein
MKWRASPDGKGGAFVFNVPGSANVLHLRGGASTRFAHIALHKTDLKFASECLKLAATTESRNTVTAEALWRCAVLHYSKCFAPPKVPSGRSHLDARRVFKNEPQAMSDHSLFLQIRNQQLAHDEGTHNFWSVGAAIAPLGEQCKVMRVIAGQVEGVSLSDENLTKLGGLIQQCAAWAEAEFNELTVQIVSSLEPVPHEDLLRHRSAQMKFPPTSNRAKR